MERNCCSKVAFTSESYDLTPGDASAAGWITMLNHNVEINHIHSGAICNEIGERLHIAFIRPESNELPLVMKKLCIDCERWTTIAVRCNDAFRIPCS